MSSIYTTAKLETFTITDKHGDKEYKVKITIDPVTDVEIADYNNFTVSKFGKVLEMVVGKGYKDRPNMMTIGSDRTKKYVTKLVEPYFEFTQRRHLKAVYKDQVVTNIRCEIFVDSVYGIKIRLEMPDLELHDTVQVKQKKKNKLKGIPLSDQRSKKVQNIVGQLIASGEFTGLTYTDAKGHEYFISLDGLLDS